METTVTVPAARESAADDVLARLEDVCATKGADTLAGKLAALRLWIDDDLTEVERALRAFDEGETPMHRSAKHLLALDGKRLRPMCVVLAARIGRGLDVLGRELAVAVELVHNATLLHDDVVDLGDVRRGAETARMVYGNAASIFGGDWLLVEALRRIQSTGHYDLLERAIGVLREMLVAEGLQLANRGSMRGSVGDYFRVVEGKTASLFRWALYAGGRAGGVDRTGCEALEQYGRSLGVAFQVVDDVLDVSGDVSVVGKSLFADLREGKMTYPLLLAVQRDAALGKLIEDACADASGASLDTALEKRAATSLRATGALDESVALARRLSADAASALEVLPPSRARDALTQIAAAMLHRKK